MPVLERGPWSGRPRDVITFNGVLIRVHQVDEGTHVQVWGIRDLGRGEERSCRRQHGALRCSLDKELAATG